MLPAVRSPWQRLLPVLVVLAGGLSPGTVEAGVIERAHVVEHVAELEPVAAQVVAQSQGDGIAIGYRYQVMSIMSLPVWTTEGRFVLFRADEHWNLPQTRVAEAAGVDSIDALPRPWGYRVPMGMVVAMVLLVAGVLAIDRVLRRQRA